MQSLEELKKTRKSNPDLSLSRKKPIAPILHLDQTYVIERRASSFESFIDPFESFEPSIHDNIHELPECPFIDGDLSIFDYSSGEDEKISEPDKKIPPNPPVRSDSTLRREKAPKIVGGFLKKPVEVEDTAIDWIPFPGKKLPRKSSFKRLLSILAGNKITDKVEKLYFSFSKIEKRNRTPDSGYDDKESVSSSHSSLSSVPEVLLHQHNIPVESIPSRTASLSTFQAEIKTQENDIKPAATEEKFEEDIYSDIYGLQSVKLLLEEVPRSEVRVSLGPFFPLAPNKIVKSLGRKNPTRQNNPEHQPNVISSSGIVPCNTEVTQLPKHPFLSSHPEEDCNSITSIDETETVELRPKNFSPTWSFPTSDIVYDVPKNYFSTSEPTLENFYKRCSNSTQNPIVYDVPKIIIPPRPKSSIFEDAQSLKRRTESIATYPQYYAFSPVGRKEFATIKPRNCRILPNNDLLKSMSDIQETSYTSTYSDRFVGDHVTEF